MNEDLELARLLVVVADQYPLIAGLLRRTAQRLVIGATAEVGGCERCGRELDQLGRGRPRRFCTTCSPRKVPKTGG